MNRQKRRALGLKVDQLTVDVAKNKAMDYTTSAILACLIKVMHDNHGWGRARLLKLMDDITEQFECVTAGTVTLDDLKSMVEAEMGIKLT